MGFDLPKAKQEKLKNNIKTISKLSIDFSKNIDEYRIFILISEEETKGLPENFKNSLEKVDGKYKITLDYPILNPFYNMLRVERKEKKSQIKAIKKEGKINIDLLSQIVKIKK